VSNTDIKKIFGASVKFWRNRLGISQEALAERSNMHRTYICDVERGSRNVSLETIERLAGALEISTYTLFFNFHKISSDKSAPRPVPADEMVDILYVEDNPDDANLAMRALKRLNFINRIQLVHDGAEALDFLFCTGAFSQRRPEDLPQIILLDLNLPKVNGLEVLRRIKGDTRMRSIPVVVLTVSNRSQDVTESRRLGADAYIVKPVDFQNFSEVVPKLNLQWAVLKPTSADVGVRDRIRS
jgi:CheY-like chemotaxis protein/DNA-binding XRE family transcriptional regulator